MKKYTMVFILCLFLSVCSSFVVYAEEFTSIKTGLDVIFVMDYSGSMSTNDSSNIAKGMVKAFIDTVHSADIRVGFVAYTDKILTSTSPMEIQTTEQRNALKTLIDQEKYSGSTDIGLGLSYGVKLLGENSERKQVIVLISDGETDLNGSNTGRTMAVSQMDMEQATNLCEQNGVKIYTIAFGNYDGNIETLKNISERTSAQMYKAETPQKLIEILYGIFGTNMDYSIEEITNSVFAPGIQNIRVGLKEKYLDEVDVLLISPEKIGDVKILYGEQTIEAVNLGNYAVAKITEIDNNIKELTVQAETLENQELQLYVISYRALVPVVEMDTSTYKNQPLGYKVYFQDKQGNLVGDETFYENFSYHSSISHQEQENLSLENTEQENTEIAYINGCMEGQVEIKESGKYFFQFYLEDSMGNSTFAPIPITVENRAPQGALPENETLTVFTKQRSYPLNQYFSDPDGDALTYLVKENNLLQAEIIDNTLTIGSVKSGTQTILLEVSDGEEVRTYSYTIEVVPIWKTCWWIVFVAVGGVVAVVVWKRKNQPKPKLEKLTKDTKENHFCGRLDVYVTAQPQEEEEIPPLSFQLYKIRENHVELGALLKEYPKAVEAMELDNIHLVADQDRRMVLYHTSNSSVMIGNSIACKQIQYSVSFGDVIYIIPSEGHYEIEIHYVAVIQ